MGWVQVPSTTTYSVTVPNVPLLTVNAALISDSVGVGVNTLADGRNNEGVALSVSGANSALKFGNNLFVVISDSTGNLQVLKSDLSGLVWALSGASTTQTKHGGGMCSVLNGSTIICGYAGTVTNDGYFRTFDLLTLTWSAETHFNVHTLNININNWEGPYSVFIRPDSSVVLIGDQTAGTANTIAIIIVAGVPVSAVLFPQAVTNTQIMAQLMDPDGTIHIFSAQTVGGLAHPQHQILHTDNSTSNLLAMGGLPQIMDWNGDGIEQGLITAGTIYLAAGKNTVTPGIFGRPVIVYGNDGAWNMTPELDAALDPDLSVWDGNLFLQGGFFVAVFRYVHSNGSNSLVHRWGYVVKADFANPAKWVWATVYDFASPVPLVDGVGPYSTVAFRGMNTGVVLGSDNVIRFCTTASGVKQFTALLFSIAFPSAASTPTHFPYIDVNGIPAIPINFRIASPSGMIWRQVCDPDEHPKKEEETECSQ